MGIGVLKIFSVFVSILIHEIFKIFEFIALSFEVLKCIMIWGFINNWETFVVDWGFLGGWLEFFFGFLGFD